MADGSRSGCSCSRAIWSGLFSSSRRPLPIRFDVVSKPAAYRRTVLVSSSPWLSRSPASSTWISAVSSRSSGWERLSSISSVKYRCSSSPDAAARSNAASSAAASMNDVTSRTSGWMCSLPSRGTPSSSLMTATGNGMARSAMTSPPPCSANRSRTGVSSASIRGRSSSTRRGVNARETSPRIRVWSGGLRNSIDDAPSSSRPRACPLTPAGRSMSGSGRPSRGWRSTSRQSSYPASPRLPNAVRHRPGASVPPARSAAYAGYGS